MAVRFDSNGLPPLPEPLRPGDKGYRAPDVPPPVATPASTPISGADYAKCVELRKQIKDLTKQRENLVRNAVIIAGAGVVVGFARKYISARLEPQLPPRTASREEDFAFFNNHFNELMFIHYSPLLLIGLMSATIAPLIRVSKLNTPLTQAISQFQASQCRTILDLHAEARKAMGLPAQQETQFSVVDLPQDIQSVVSTRIETDAEMAAYASEDHRGLWARGVEFLDALPATIESELPESVRYSFSTELYLAGMSIGIVRSAGKAIQGIPDLVSNLFAGRLSFLDVGTGIWTMVKTDAGKLWDAPSDLFSGNPLTAGSNTGDVAFDVFTTVEGGASALKAGKILTQGAKFTIKAAVQTTATASKSLEQMIQQVGETLAFGGMMPAYATVAVADESALMSTMATLPELPGPQAGLSCAMASTRAAFNKQTKPFTRPVSQDDLAQLDIPEVDFDFAEEHTPATPVAFGVVAHDLRDFLSGLRGYGHLRQSTVVDAMKSAGIPKEVPRHFSYLGTTEVPSSRIIGRSASIPGTNGLQVGLTRQKIIVKGRPSTIDHVTVWKTTTTPGVRGK